MSESIDKPNFIVVEGPIGVGKTSLVHRLADHFGSEMLLEGAEENPFLQRFYANPREAALPAQLFFLFQRSRQWNDLSQGDMFRQHLIADFMLEKDRLFAQINLDADEMRLYEQVYEHLTLEAPLPDLVVYLQAPVDVLMKRIKRRSRPVERKIEPGYLQQLCDAYADFFHYYDRSPLLIVNAAEIDPLKREEDFQLLLTHICDQGAQRRRYLNLTGFSL
ncbi:MAG: deoxynucleoside kinase [gamma proteobacterium symbiont of Ctena orbiculata]|uniref:Deoxynucleoside kinase n=1 Tax=Candidatus Thiodiazotropha taylori TaxID=2792791 RepID=A0A944QUZ7_9GAMM|nr:deoxynucleoside kinase [Candidatus Thiodiazotropha taylori]PUB87422.1 MAG: deoxynucleoside kinase [gamma proteobacterium symbiont of Ctena orbiculata]MBT2990677.1 deoxynucleoside kinase [Candidatus Thiodiazotropha taylori]MBT2996839.1 deoxynucleoside kinase [Candidatus Thiodiazotropha taylori]MBT3002072.1 deoxynucleoside kinase [Candidatus Thiodiazotropha taylori]